MVPQKLRAQPLRLLVALALAIVPIHAEVSPDAGDPAPELVLEKLLQAPPDATAERTSLEGHVVVLDFWATWCAPCVQAIPHHNELVEAFDGRPVRFISISDEDESVVSNFLDQRPIGGWIGIDRDGSSFADYGVKIRPTLVVIDPAGKIVAVDHPERLTAEHLESVLKGQPIVGPELPAPRVSPVAVDDEAGSPALFQVVIRPVRWEDHVQRGGKTETRRSETFFEGRSLSVLGVLCEAHDITESRVDIDFLLPTRPHDVFVYPGGLGGFSWREFLQRAVESTFSLSTKRENREERVYVLEAPAGRPRVLEPGTRPSQSRTSPGKISMQSTGMTGFALALSEAVGRPVLDETGLSGAYDLELEWDPADPGALSKAVSEQLGLVLEPRTRMIEILIVARREDGESQPRPPVPDQRK